MKLLSITFVSIFSLSLNAQLALAIDPIALTGDAAPGTSATFAWVDIPYVGGGDITFVGQLSGTGVTSANDYGIWSNGSGSLSLVAREGTGGLGHPTQPMTDGDPVYQADVTVSGTNYDTLFENAVEIAQEGDVAPGAGGATYLDTFNSLKNGDLGFRAKLGANDYGVFVYDGTSTSLVQRTGDTAPGTAYTLKIMGLAGLNSSGNFGYTSTLQRISAPTFGLWGPSGLIALEGDSAPGTAQTFSKFEYPDIDTSSTVFRGTAGSGGSATVGLWYHVTATGLELIVKGGDTAPGTSGRTFVGTTLSPCISGEDVLFYALATNGSNNYPGIWKWNKTAGTISSVAFYGDAAPGTEVGVTYSAFSGLTMNGNGKAVFKADLLGGSSSKRQGIWGYNISAGTVSLIVRKTDAFLDSSGAPQTIGTITLGAGYSGGNDGKPNHYASNGDLVFKALFNGSNTGIFRVNW